MRGTGWARRLIGWLVALWPLAALAQQVAPPAALDRVGPKQPITAYNGSYTYSIPIEVPKFRGLEPALSLSYDSARGIRNIASTGGWLGVGWKLEGVSAIERVSGAFPRASGQDKKTGGRGSPAYGIAGSLPDHFAIDGVELIACSDLQNTTTSPSCIAGGTHAPRVETFLRYKALTASYGWEVTEKDGTKRAYASLQGATSFDQTFRWHLTRVTDVRGNHVDYAWSCPVGEACVVSDIKYFNQDDATTEIDAIRFLYEIRPDPISTATGQALQTIKKRLIAIDVLGTRARARAYKLSYDTGTATALSRLVSVQQYGKDAQFTGAAITGGTPLAPTTLTYANPPRSFTASSGQLESGLGGDSIGDVNGDGRTDLISIVDPSGGNGQPVHCGGVTVWFSTSTGHSTSGSLVVSGGAATDIADCRHFGVAATGDFNGDRRSDVVISSRVQPNEGGAGSWGVTGYMWVSNAWVAVRGPGAQGTTPQRLFNAGDFDGDGKDELVTSVSTATPVIMKYNPGPGGVEGGPFFESTTWVPATFPPLGAGGEGFNKPLDVLDINGDGRAELLSYDAFGGATTIYRFNGTTLTAGTPSGLPSIPYSALTRFLIADFNGDGRSDAATVTHVSSPLKFQLKLYLSDGQKWNATAAPVLDVVPIGTLDARSFEAFAIGDFNGDGRADVFVPMTRTSNGTGDPPFLYRHRVVVSNGDSFAPAVDWGNTGQTFATGDFDGDGRTDAIIFGASFRSYLLGTGTPADLLTNIIEPLGGKVAVTYSSSAGTPNTILPFVLQTAASITVDDGRGGTGTPVWSATTSYGYQGGQWDANEREFLGFQLVIATLPLNTGETAAPSATTTFQQTVACLGRASRIDSRNGAGTLLRSEIPTYVADSVLPLTCLPAHSYTYDYEGTPSARASHVYQGFDVWGNKTREIRYGDDAFTGDESNDFDYFYPNTSLFITGCEARRLTYAGTTTSAKLADAQHYFDGQSGITTPPTRCEETWTREWIDTVGAVTRYRDTRATYDAYGNIASRTDPAGGLTTFIYGDATKANVTETRLPKFNATPSDARFKTTSTWDLACGVEVAMVDINAQTTTRDYDNFCRIVREVRPGGERVRTVYQDMPYFTTLGAAPLTDPLPGTVSGSAVAKPATQYVETIRSAPEGGFGLWARDYTDGFGRKYKELDRGPASAGIRTDYVFTKRSMVESVSAPRYDGAAAKLTQYKYDALDRLIEQRHPDNATVALAHNVTGTFLAGEIATVRVTDETARQTLYGIDAYGKVVRREKRGLDGAATPRITVTVHLTQHSSGYR
jgi:YD repeat-containing protein